MLCSWHSNAIVSRVGPHPFPFSGTWVFYKHMQQDRAVESNTALLEEEERIAEREANWVYTNSKSGWASRSRTTPVEKYNTGGLNRETLSIPKKSQVTAITIRAGRRLRMGKFCSQLLRGKSGVFSDKQKQSLLIQTTSITLPSCAETLNKRG